MTSQPDHAYRSSAMPPALAELVSRGRELRGTIPGDPHAVRAPKRISDPLATGAEETAAAYEDAFGNPLLRPRGLRVLGALVLAPFILLAGLAGLAVTLMGRMFLPAFLVFTAMVVGVVLAVQWRRNQPRRWLSRMPLNVDGYLELLGRENRVVRMLVQVRFKGAAPEVDFAKDVLTGARCLTLGVQAGEGGALAVFSPEIAGQAPWLHRWFQTLCDQALVPLDQGYPITRVELQER